MTEDGMHFCSGDAGLIGSFLVTTLGLGPAFPSFGQQKLYYATTCCVMNSFMQKEARCSRDGPMICDMEPEENVANCDLTNIELEEFNNSWSGLWLLPGLCVFNGFANIAFV